jgi:hypothetical protein
VRVGQATGALCKERVNSVSVQEKHVTGLSKAAATRSEVTSGGEFAERDDEC